EVVWRCLEKKPEDRFQSAGELTFQLQRLSALASSGRETPSARDAQQPTQIVTPVPGRRLRWPWMAAALAGLAALLALGVARWRAPSVVGLGTADKGPGPEAAPSKTRRSVAVLGFKNLSGRADEAWLSTALSEMLTTELAAGEKLRTIPEENV